MNINPHIKEIQALKRQKDSDKANQLLIKLSNHVHKIMTNRGYKVLHLKEFYPKNKNLLGLNMNRGYCIKIRLRHPEDNIRFLEFNDLIGTMLHELVHNKFGPHDNKFYKLLDELWTEYEKSIGDGFMPDGVQLQGRKMDQEDRLKALEKRVWLASLMGPARKLGGGNKELSPAEMVRMATLKRIEENQRCKHVLSLTLEESEDDEYEQDTTLRNQNSLEPKGDQEAKSAPSKRVLGHTKNEILDSDESMVHKNDIDSIHRQQNGIDIKIKRSKESESNRVGYRGESSRSRGPAPDINRIVIDLTSQDEQAQPVANIVFIDD